MKGMPCTPLLTIDTIDSQSAGGCRTNAATGRHFFSGLDTKYSRGEMSTQYCILNTQPPAQADFTKTCNKTLGIDADLCSSAYTKAMTDKACQVLDATDTGCGSLATAGIGICSLQTCPDGVNCAEGTYEACTGGTAAGATFCTGGTAKPCTTCTDTQTVATACTPIKDTVCSANECTCPNGTVVDQCTTTGVHCQKCQPGFTLQDDKTCSSDATPAITSLANFTPGDTPAKPPAPTGTPIGGNDTCICDPTQPDANCHTTGGIDCPSATDSNACNGWGQFGCKWTTSTL